MIARLTLFLALFIVSSCTAFNRAPCIYQLDPAEKVSLSNLEQPLREIAGQMCSKDIHPVVIPDFLEIKTFKATPIGLMLGDLLRSYYSEECKGGIIQVEFPRNFQLTQDGLISLTRNPELIKNTQISFKEAIVGTYSYTDSILRVFVRKIDVETGVIVKMITKDIPLQGCGR